jgi:fatty acid desaturase
MPNTAKQDRRDLAIILAGLMLVLFASPLIFWWSSPDMPWYVPYILWLLIILLAAYLHWWRLKHEP